MRRYSKQPHLWRSSKRLAKLLTNPMERPTEPTSSVPHMHKLAQRLTAEEVRALQDAYQAGASLAELQQRFHLSRGSVQRLLREAGVRRRRKSLTDPEVAELVARYIAGLTIREVAAEQDLPRRRYRMRCEELACRCDQRTDSRTALRRWIRPGRSAAYGPVETRSTTSSQALHRPVAYCA